MNYWILKTDSDTYSINDLKRDKETDWDGVRNYQARNNIRNMEPGDMALIYHSVTERQIMGIAEITSTPFVDKTAVDDNWSAVKIKFVNKLKKPIPLDTVKTDKKLSEIGLVKQSRLSVIPITEEQYEYILSLGK